MAATIHVPEDLAQQLKDVAREEGIDVEALIGRMIAEYLERGLRPIRERKTVQLPLISREEAPVVRSFTGAEIDELFADEDLASGR